MISTASNRTGVVAVGVTEQPISALKAVTNRNLLVGGKPTDRGAFTSDVTGSIGRYATSGPGATRRSNLNPPT